MSIADFRLVRGALRAQLLKSTIENRKSKMRGLPSRSALRWYSALKDVRPREGSGAPAPNALRLEAMFGSRFQCSNPNIFPVRPRPIEAWCSTRLDLVEKGFLLWLQGEM
jgi:hypothetical protein